KISQVVGRIKKKFKRVKLCKDEISLRETSGRLIRYEINKPGYLGSRCFFFLNVRHEITSWNDECLDKLWLYNLHYFNDLNSTGSLLKTSQLNSLIESWIQENPPFYGNGWEPYPISLRVVNWIKYFLHLKTYPYYYLESLYQQVNALEQQLEYHLLGNHLFSNAKALLFAGLFFDGERANFWIKKGLSILDKEITEQILPDGGYFELSPMYHNIILSDLLDLYNLSSVYPYDFMVKRRRKWLNIINSMIQWGKHMSHPDGEISFFNDSAMKVAPSMDDIYAYAKALGINISDVRMVPTTQFTYKHLYDSGYVSVVSQNIKAILDLAKVGPDYIPGHAHADTLSFEMSFFGLRVFVNSGTSVYGLGQERLRQRKTQSHNTVEVDGKDSSEIWGGFRVARRAYPSDPIISYDDCLTISCGHDGYKRLPGRVDHLREWSFFDNKIIITDNLVGQFSYATAYYHLHPDIHVEQLENVVQLTLSSGQKIQLESNIKIEVQSSTWHPEFGISVSNKKLVIKTEGSIINLIVRY
ncbi:alginate lyase family protein, partial [Escherichia coli]